MRPVHTRKRAPLPERDPQDVEISWDRLPTETAKSFEAFVMYRDMGTSRSLTAVAKNLKPGHPISVQAVSEWSIKHNWKSRCWAFDFHNQRQLQLETAALRREARERQCRLSVAMQKVAMAGMAELLDKCKAGVPLHMTPDQIAAFAKTGQELERFGLGEENDPLIIPKISVFMGGEEVEAIPAPEPPEPKKPN